MKKKIFLFGGLTLALLGAIGFGGKALPVRAEDSSISVVDSSVVVDNSATVVFAELEHGKVEADILTGMAGDICTLTIKCDLLFAIKAVKVNGADIVAGEDGIYKFALVAGENKVEVLFCVDNETFGEMAGIISEIEKASKNEISWSQVLTVENLIIVINCVINLVYGLSFLKTYIKNKKIQNMDRTQIVETIRDVLPDQVNNIITGLVNSNLLPVLSPMLDKMEVFESSFKTFMNCFLYSMENTPEAKQKIIELIGGIKNSDTTTVEAVKQYFEEKLRELAAQFEANKQLLEELTAANNKAKEEAGEEAVVEDNGTQLG